MGCYLFNFLGAPDFNPPDFVLKNAKHAIDNFPHQYSRSAGAIPLVNALANLYSPHFNRKVDAMNEIVVTGGATEGGCSAMLGLVNPGDEVVAFEPFYDGALLRSLRCCHLILLVCNYLRCISHRSLIALALPSLIFLPFLHYYHSLHLTHCLSPPSPSPSHPCPHPLTSLNDSDSISRVGEARRRHHEARPPQAQGLHLLLFKYYSERLCV